MQNKNVLRLCLKQLGIVSLGMLSGTAFHACAPAWENALPQNLVRRRAEYSL